MTSTPARLLTAEELFDRDDDGRRYELVRGELYEVSPASPRSSAIAGLIVWWLWSFVRPRALGKVFPPDAGFILARNPDVVRAPDAAFVRADRLPSEPEQDFFLALAPDLAVEVVSPSDRMTDVNDKVAEYRVAGVRLVWVVEPRARRATVYRPDGSAHVLGPADSLDGEDVLPGFRLPLAELFA